MVSSQRHSYHLVDPSPWPISGSLGALATTVGGVMYMHSFTGGAKLLSLGSIFIPYTMFVRWRDVIRESTLEGHHTKVVQLGPRYGFIPSIVSEVMFFYIICRGKSALNCILRPLTAPFIRTGRGKKRYLLYLTGN